MKFDKVKGMCIDGLDWFETDKLDVGAKVTIYYEIETRKLFHVFLGDVDLYWLLNASAVQDANNAIAEHLKYANEVDL